MKADFWNKKFSNEEYIYGSSPNVFIEQQLANLKVPQKILFAGAGEGRNAVYAARKGHDVYAYDQSDVAAQKAHSLAAQLGVDLAYTVEDALNISYPTECMDIIVMNFFHLPSDIRSMAYNTVSQFLKVGGLLVAEFFHKDQLGKASGGPQSIEMLYDEEDINALFPNFRFTRLEKASYILDEGPLHQGEAAVLRLVGEKTCEK